MNDKNLHSHTDSRGGVEHIDENEAEGDKKNNPRHYSEYLQGQEILVTFIN